MKFRKDMTLARIINAEIGNVKYIPKGYTKIIAESLRRFHYVQEKGFTDEELLWHVVIIAQALFSPRVIVYK